MGYKPGPMTLDQCAARMTALLASKPRKARTRALLETLPKRERQIVRAEEYEQAKAAAMVVIERAQRGDAIAPQPATPVGRKDRLRSRARASLWNCRPTGFRQREGRRLFDYPPRSMEDAANCRRTLFAAQEGLCALCGMALAIPATHGSLDHVIPRFDGGADALGNLVLSHYECNGRKSNDVPTGCELVALLAVNARLGVEPMTW